MLLFASRCVRSTVNAPANKLMKIEKRRLILYIHYTANIKGIYNKVVNVYCKYRRKKSTVKLVANCIVQEINRKKKERGERKKGRKKERRLPAMEAIPISDKLFSLRSNVLRLELDTSSLAMRRPASLGRWLALRWRDSRWGRWWIMRLKKTDRAGTFRLHLLRYTCFKPK